MISIIICSINTDYLKDVQKNILETIGVGYELLVWDNRVEKKSICEVYNIMASRAKYPYCCFLHEDILFKTEGWGILLADSFRQDPALGVIGVAGSKYKSRIYSGWHTALPGADHYNIIHRHRSTGEEHHWKSTGGEDVTAPRKVVCIDGVMMACRTSVWEEVKFDDILLKGFHFYDIDFSLRATGICEVAVLLNIDIVHITFGGDYGDPWVRAAIQYHHGRDSSLPASVGEELPATHPETAVARLWLDRLKTEKISFTNRWKWIGYQGLLRTPSLWYEIVKFMVYKPFRLQRLHHFLKS